MQEDRINFAPCTECGRYGRCATFGEATVCGWCLLTAVELVAEADVTCVDCGAPGAVDCVNASDMSRRARCVKCADAWPVRPS